MCYFWLFRWYIFCKNSIVLKRKLFWFVIFYFTGIFFQEKLQFIFTVFLLTGSLSLLALNRLSRALKNLVIFFVFCFLLGFFAASCGSKYLEQKLLKAENFFSQKPEIELKISSDIIKTERGLSFTGTTAGYKIKVSLTTLEQDKYCYGDILFLKEYRFFKLIPATNFGLSVYDDYLKLHKYCGRLAAKESAVLELRRPPFSLGRGVIFLKNKLAAVNFKTMPAKEAAVLNSIIFGTAAAPLSAETQLQYKRVGIIHLLVVSGSQIAILVGVALMLAKLLRLSPLATFFMTSLFNIGFTVAVGGGASIMRACLMAEITLAGGLLGRSKDFWTALAFSAFLLSLGNFRIIFDIGFQLSYAATASLIYMTPVLAEYFKKKNFPEKITEILSVSLAPFFFTTPLAVYYFNGFSLVSLPVNLLTVFWVEFLVILGFSSALLGLFFLPLAYILNLFNFLLLKILNIFVDLFGSLPLAYLDVKQISFFLLILIYLALFLLVEFLKTKKIIYRQYTLILLVVIFGGYLINFSPDILTVDIFDVGQGDAIFLDAKKAGRILIDCGSDDRYFEPGSSVVIPALIKKGIKELDYLVITHEHFDHYSGVPAILKKIKVKNLILPKAFTREEILSEANKRNILISCLAAGDFLPLKGAACRLLHPGVFYSGDANNSSYVFLFKIKDFKILLTGDIAEEAENEILAQEKELDIDVLKVAHHGSRYSSTPEFLSAARPQHAIISAGRVNKFSHPHQEAIERLTGYARVYSTNRQGAVRIAVKKKGDYKILTKLPAV